MPSTDIIIINTGPIIAIVAALGDLDVLSQLYSKVIVPHEVCEEILTKGPVRFAQNEFNNAQFLSNQNMTNRGVWLSDTVKNFALKQAGE